MKLYRLYIDESGDHNCYETSDPAKIYLGLTGILIEYDDYRTTFQPKLELLKQKHFPHSPDEPVILHREDIINKRGPFWRLRDPEKEKAFNDELLQFLKDQKYCIITVVIDKNRHIKRYGDIAYHPYHYCLTAMLERHCGYLNFYNVRGDVMAESRGGKEDRLLKIEYKRLYEKGSNQRDSNFFQKALTSCEIKLKPKRKNIAGLQIADILAHPSKQEILIEKKRISDFGDNFGKQICQCIQTKYNQQVYDGRIWGYGKIFLG